MAGSRLPNFGTIFSRVTGLMQTGAVKEKPLWYDVYRKFPPEIAPQSERSPIPQDPILEIVYEEDFERAKQALVTRKPRTARAPKASGKTETRKESTVE